MKKLFLLMLTMAVAVSFAMPAMATDARVMALGNTQNYLEDDYNIFAWPATLPSYANLVMIGLCGDPDYCCEYYYPYYANGWEGYYCQTIMGGILGLGEDNKYGALGMFFFEGTPGINPIPYSEFYGAWEFEYLFASTIYNKFNVLWGYDMEGLSFGFNFERADQMWKEENDVEYENKHAYTKFAASVRFDVGEAGYADLAFNVAFASMTDTLDGYGERTEDGNMLWGVQGRMFYEYSEMFTFVPYIGVSMFDFSTKVQRNSEDYADYYYGEKGMMFNTGFGIDMTVNEDNMLLFAIEPYSFGKFEPSEPPDGVEAWGKVVYFPRFRLALESDVKDWLTFRAGCVKELQKTEVFYSYEDDESTYTDTCGDFYYMMGLGFHIGDFDIDCVVNNELPFTMGYWLTGFENTEQPIWMLTALYHF